MMRFRGKRLGAALASAVTALLAVIVVGWIVTTNDGTRWLLTTLLPMTGINLSAQRIEGKIVDHLQLTGVRISMDKKKLELDRMELSWKPLLLLGGSVAVKELALAGVRIQDDTPPDTKPLTLAWPHVSSRTQLFDGKIERLTVTNLRYCRMQEQPLQVTSLAASVTWQDDLLSITDLQVESSSGRMQGSVAAGFNQPSLIADLVIAPAQPVATMDRFSLQIRRSSGKGPEPFTGMITLAGSAGVRKLLELTGDIGMAKSAINLRQLSLTRPGQRGRITAEGSLDFSSREAVAALKIVVAELNLAPELKFATNLTGNLTFAGTLDRYRGEFNLANKSHGWRQATAIAPFKGTRDGMTLGPLKASVLDGILAGNLDLDWRSGFALRGALSGRNLNPARIDPGWKGVANFNADGSLAWSGNVPPTGSIRAALLESSLHGQALTGGLQADFAGNNISLARLLLKGKGFDLHASGELNQRLALTAQITDFSRLVPGSSGTLQAEGWLRWNDGQFSGSINGTGSQLAFAGSRVANATLSARLDRGQGYPMHIAASLRDVVYNQYALTAVSLAADGTLAHHSVNAALRSKGSEARLSLAAGYNAGTWKGEITQLAGRDDNGPWKLTAPATFAINSERFSLAPLSLRAGAEEHFDVAADLGLKPLDGQVRVQWTGLNLSRANPWLKDARVSGSSHGTVKAGFQSGSRLTLAGSAGGSGTFTTKGHSITFLRSQVAIDGNEKGLHGVIDLSTASGGSLKGTFSSPDPLRLAIPERGKLTADFGGFDLVLLKPWLPRDTGIEGRISGRANGVMLPGQRFELDGNAQLSGGIFHQVRPDGELNLAFSSASATWVWRGEALSGTLSLKMTENGQARADFQLPIAAQFPVVVNPKGSLRASFSGQFKEKGMITALFPGLVQESFGDLEAELKLGGTWEAPQAGGELRLSKAGAYLPTAGIHLKDVQLAAHLEKDLIRIDSYRAVSGPGHIEGAALISLDGWEVTGFRGTLRGENFQTVYFPELRIVSTPDLTFEGTPEKLILRGELHLPELNIVGAQSRSVVAPSSDVILVGRTVPVVKSSPLMMDVKIRLMLGDKVFVKVAGIDAQLDGAMNVSMSSLDRITSTGEIKVVKGRYRTYGVNLEIIRGRLFYAGGAIDRPSLDFLALRTIGDVKAGVTVAGTLQKPVTKLYSEPVMPDVDVLAYVVLGHPIGSSGEQTSLMVQAAGALLTTSQAATLTDQLKNKLGLNTLEIQGGVGKTPGTMGYKPLVVTPPGSIPAIQQPGLTETMLTVGKYLTPKIYISYGKSLFTGSNVFRLRYDIFKQWQIETQTGTESGADLYYKLEFK